MPAVGLPEELAYAWRTYRACVERLPRSRCCSTRPTTPASKPKPAQKVNQRAGTASSSLPGVPAARPRPTVRSLPLAQGVEEGAGGFHGVVGEPERAGEDIGGAAGDDGEAGKGVRIGAVVQQAVDDLVDRAVAAEGHDQLYVFALGGLPAEIPGVPAVLRRGHLELHLAGQGVDQDVTRAGTGGGCCRIDHEKCAHAGQITGRRCAGRPAPDPLRPVGGRYPAEVSSSEQSLPAQDPRPRRLTAAAAVAGAEALAIVAAGVYLLVMGTLVDALTNNRLAGAAIDVFEKEPITDHPLFGLENVVVTPHLGASTAEAQERVAVDVAHQIVAVLNGEPARWAVNAPMIDPETYAYLAPYMPVGQKIGALAVQLHTGQMNEVEIDYAGDIAHHDVTPLRAAVIGGLLAGTTVEHVSLVNVDMIAERRGMQLKQVHSPSHEIYSNLITVRLRGKDGHTEVAGTIAPDGPHIVSIDEVWVDVPPSEGYLLLVENRDRPGMVGGVGTLMGEFGVNISYMNVGAHAGSGNALMVLTLDQTLAPEQLEKVREISGVLAVRLARL